MWEAHKIRLLNQFTEFMISAHNLAIECLLNWDGPIFISFLTSLILVTEDRDELWPSLILS